MHYDICCIGHITLDKVVTQATTVYMPGGTAYYFSCAMAALDISYLLVTAVAESEIQFVNALQEKGVDVQHLFSKRTVFFENKYGDNPNQRTQKVLQQADPFPAERLSNLDATIFHLGPLLADDIPAEAVKALAAKGKLSLDVQGLLRQVENQHVKAVDWKDKEALLPYIHFLKASEEEMIVLTGCTDLYEGARKLAQSGVKEVVITLGSEGSLVCCEGIMYRIPAYKPTQTIDVTGCGDTYMAGYLLQRVKGYSIQQAGEFGAAIATLKVAQSGPFAGTEEDVKNLLKKHKGAVKNSR